MTQETRGRLDIEDRGAMLIVRIDGGPRGVFGLRLAEQLEELVDRVDRDPGVRAVVFTGVHPERFISHADVPWLQEESADVPPLGRRGAAAVPARPEERNALVYWSRWCAGLRCGQRSSSTACTQRFCG